MQKIKKIVDLSHELKNGTVVYPGDPVVDITVATVKEKDGYNLSNVHIGSQSGSHVDAPYHFKNDGLTVDRMELSYFMGNALVIDASDKGDIVLFRTDWYQYEGQDKFFRHPYLSAEAGAYLLDRGIQTLAIDAINLDRTGGTKFPVHEMYAEAGGLIAENLAHFDKIEFDEPIVIFLPLKLTGVDGSPVRAAAVSFE